MNHVVTLIGTLAVITSIVRSWPQVIRLLRGNTSAKGVSVATWCIGTAGQTGWAVWGFANHVPAAMISNTLNSIGCSAVLLAICRVRAGASRTIARTLFPLLVVEL